MTRQLFSLSRMVLFIGALTAAMPARSEAGARRFTYVYEANTAAPGAFELESWITWRTHRGDDHGFNAVEFRHELEFGITDRLQAAIYLADWSYREGRSVADKGVSYSASAIELMYNLTNPETAPLGSALYGELRIGPDEVELESKVILQKNFDRWLIAYNATLDALWEGDDLQERSGEFQQSVGLSYEITPRLLAGAELLHEIAFPEWEKAGDSVVYAGPNVSLRAWSWWVTATALAQLSRVREEPDFQLRTIVGYTF